MVFIFCQFQDLTIFDSINEYAMDVPEFNKYPLKERIYLIFEHGNEIASRKFLYFNIKLYSLFGFFAEVWYIPNSNKIEKVESLSTDEILILYKNEFDITELLK